MTEKPVIYEPHPVTPERKEELKAQGYQIIDAIFDPNPEAPKADKVEKAPKADK